MSELDVIQGFFKKEQKDKIDKYRILNETVVKGQILFTGSSLMEQYPQPAAFRDQAKSLQVALA